MKAAERSFTLIETIFALGLVIYLVVEFTGVQGSAISAFQYGKNVLQASYLAQRILSQVEYHSVRKPFKDLAQVNEKEKEFEDVPDFKYSLEIKEWKLPILSLLSGQLNDNSQGKKAEDKDDDDKSSGGPFDSILKQILGDDLLKIAHVEITWPEGATRQSFNLSYLLVNQSKLDEVIGTMAVLDANAPKDPNKPTSPTTPPGPGTPPATTSGTSTTSTTSTSGTSPTTSGTSGSSKQN